MRRATWHKQAKAEADDAFSWHLDRSPGTAAAFMAAVDSAMATLRSHPQAGARIAGDIRRFHVPGYPFIVVYRQTARGIRVLAFANTSRHPGFWTGRR